LRLSRSLVELELLTIEFDVGGGTWKHIEAQVTKRVNNESF